MIARSGAALRQSAVLAAALSFVFPGLGQAVGGALRRGLLLAAPVLLLVVGVLLVTSTQGTARTLGLLLQPWVLIGLLLINALLLAYRLGAILDAYYQASLRAPSGSGANRMLSLALLGVVLAGTMGMHAYVGYVGYKTFDFVTTVFHPVATPSPTPEPSLAPDETPDPTPLPTPPALSWASDGRLDLLLVGGDAGPGRWSLRTDTMILLTVDLASRRATMFGIPRNLRNVPLPAVSAEAFACGCFPEIINGLWVYAAAHPQDFPGDDDRGYRALQGAIEALVDRPLDGMVVVTLQGFVRIVDELGGLDITVPTAIYDANYPKPDGSGNRELYIPAGFHHMTGDEALAYARTRHQDNDYNRMQRQQAVLLAMRRQFNPCTLIPRIPGLLDIARDTFWTNVPIETLPEILALGAGVDASRITGRFFWPPEIPEGLGAAALAKIRAMVADPFNVAASPSAGPTVPASSDPAPIC